MGSQKKTSHPCDFVICMKQGMTPGNIDVLLWITQYWFLIIQRYVHVLCAYNVHIGDSKSPTYFLLYSMNTHLNKTLAYLLRYLNFAPGRSKERAVWWLGMRYGITTCIHILNTTYRPSTISYFLLAKNFQKPIGCSTYL